MGFVTRSIAVITEPTKVSLATNPNFITFESKPRVRVLLEVNITVNFSPVQSGISEIIITDSEGGPHSFSGTNDITKVSGNIFFISDDKTETAENIKNALLSDRWISSNFDIKIPFISGAGSISNGTALNLRSRGTGTPYNITLTVDSGAYLVDWINPVSENNDSITGEDVSTEIELDIFEKTGVFLGGEDSPNDTATLGTPFSSVQKTYQGDPLWFELNTLLSKKVTYNVPASSGWFDTGTISDYRFIAKVKGKNSFPFYYSNVLFVLNGYGYSLDPLDLTPYIYDGTKKVKLLSNKTNGKYIRGQKEYINFILSEQGHKEGTIEIAYKLSTFGGVALATLYEHPVLTASLGIVNTCVIDLSDALDMHPNTGRVEIVLTRDRSEISEPLALEIIPECLHRLNAFVFLNKLGGWDSFNVDTESESESKQSSTTYNKTLTPKHRIGDSRETVHSVELGITYSLETDLLDTATRTWLQELLASPVIFDGDGNYIILEDSKLPISSGMDTLSLKYRLSDNYNG